MGWSAQKKLICIKHSVYLVSSTVEADEEIKKSETSRDLSEDEEKEKPSEVMGDLEKGLSAIANMMTDEFNV